MGQVIYITKSIVEAQGGKIPAFNSSSGKGATFTFTLPLQRISEYSLN
jgi:signal transduction histidine kinase